MATKVVTGVVVYLNHREMFKKQTRTILGLCATLKTHNLGEMSFDFWYISLRVYF